MRRILAREYGEDAAQEAIARLLAAQAAGTEVGDSTNFCWVTARRWLKDKQKGEFREISISDRQLREDDTELPFIDTLTPERIVSAREQLARASETLLALTVLREERGAPHRRGHRRYLPLSQEEYKVRQSERQAFVEGL